MQNVLDKRFKILWLCNLVKLDNFTAHFAICENTKKISFFSLDILKPMMIHSTKIINDDCIDSLWCLSLECPYNKTTMTSFLKANRLLTTNKAKNERIWKHLLDIVSQLNKELKKEIPTFVSNFETKGTIVFFPKPIFVVKFEKDGDSGSLGRS